MYCQSSSQIKSSSIPKTNNASIAVLSPESEEDFLVRKVTLEEGGSMPYHTNKIQHQQYVLEGEAKVRVGTQTYHAKAGDFLYIPAGIAHDYEASYGQKYVFLCMITTATDTIEMVD